MSNSKMSKNAICLQIKLDWSELDSFGHINNVSYYKYSQAARLEILELSGLMKLHKETDAGPILAHTSCKFIKPLFFPGTIEVRSFVHEIKTTSFLIKHFIFNEMNELAAEIDDVTVFYNYALEVKEKLPIMVKNYLEQIR